MSLFVDLATEATGIIFAPDSKVEALVFFWFNQ